MQTRANGGLEPDLVAFARELRGARNFVEVGLAVCRRSRQFGLDHCLISLISSEGRPAVAVDNYGMAEETRRLYFSQGFSDTTDAERDELVMPILDLSQRIGVIRCGGAAAANGSSLWVMGMHVSLRLAQLGITLSTDDRDLDMLTARQIEVARLTVQGYTNIEIAGLLGVSINTIKKHLGHVFDRFEVTNRTELAGRFIDTTHHDGLPIGVTRVGECTVTKTIASDGFRPRLR